MERRRTYISDVVTICFCIMKILLYLSVITGWMFFSVDSMKMVEQSIMSDWEWLTADCLNTQNVPKNKNKKVNISSRPTITVNPASLGRLNLLQGALVRRWDKFFGQVCFAGPGQHVIVLYSIFKFVTC